MSGVGEGQRAKLLTLPVLEKIPRRPARPQPGRTERAQVTAHALAVLRMREGGGRRGPSRLSRRTGVRRIPVKVHDPAGVLGLRKTAVFQGVIGGRHKGLLG